MKAIVTPIELIKILLMAVISMLTSLPLLILDETMQGTKKFQSMWRAGPVPRQDQLAVVRVNGSGTKLGMPVTHNGETYPDIAPAITTDISVAGIAYDVQNLLSVLNAVPAWDLDEVVPDNQELIIAKLGSDLVVPVFLEALAGPVAVAKNDLIAVGIEAGKVRKWTYADTAAATDSSLEILGTSYGAHAGHTTEDRIILLRLDK